MNSFLREIAVSAFGGRLGSTAVARCPFNHGRRAAAYAVRGVSTTTVDTDAAPAVAGDHDPSAPCGGCASKCKHHAEEEHSGCPFVISKMDKILRGEISQPVLNDLAKRCPHLEKLAVQARREEERRDEVKRALLRRFPGPAAAPTATYAVEAEAEEGEEAVAGGEQEECPVTGVASSAVLGTAERDNGAGYDPSALPGPAAWTAGWDKDHDRYELDPSPREGEPLLRAGEKRGR